MNIDKQRLKKLAEAATPGPWCWDKGEDPRPHTYGVSTDSDPECMVVNQEFGIELKEDAYFIAAASPATVLALLAEIDHLAEQNANLLECKSAVNAAVALENEALRMQVKELDLTFGRYLLGMRAAVVEWQKGKDADAAMQWIWNGLRGPGELPPEEETQAQAYFDREVVKIEEGLEEVYAYRDKRRAEKDKERGQ